MATVDWPWLLVAGYVGAGMAAFPFVTYPKDMTEDIGPPWLVLIGWIMFPFLFAFAVLCWISGKKDG